MTIAKSSVKTKVLWSLTILSILIWIGIFTGLMLESAPPIYLVCLILLFLLSGILIKLHYQKLPTSFVENLSAITGQLDKINQGMQDEVSITNMREELTDLVTQLNIHLSMETDRINQEQAFSSEASHELRTPLAGMRLQAQIAQRTENKEQQKSALSNIILAVDRSTRLVNQLLAYSRLTKRRILSEKDSIDLSDLLQESIRKYASLITKKDIQLNVDMPKEHFSLLPGHKKQLATLIENVMQNALEHTPMRGSINVQLKQSAESVALLIEDSGSGVPETKRLTIIAPFQKSEDGKQTGTGLGLAICQRIAQLHGGTLSFSDSALGGLAVTLQLPKQ